MALAIVKDAAGTEIERYQRRDARRAWLTVQGQSHTDVPIRGEGWERRGRFPVGSTCTLDGRVHAQLGADGEWHLVPDREPAPAPVPQPEARPAVAEPPPRTLTPARFPGSLDAGGDGE